MTVVPLILDRPIATAGGGCVSLLTVPLGASSLLERIVKWLGPLVEQPPLVLAASGVGDGCAEALRECCGLEFRLVGGALSETLAGLETSDRLLIVDAGRVPLLDVAVDAWWSSLSAWRGAAHLVAIGPQHLDGVRERVECDEHGQVSRVSRLLEAACWPEVADRCVVMALLPVAALDAAEVTALLQPRAMQRCRQALSPQSFLDRLRQALIRCGVLMRDEPLASALCDLTQPAGLLALAERLTWHDLSNGARRRFSTRADDVVVGRDCCIHPSVRLVGPLIIHDGVTIEPGATVIGPAALGAGCRIGRGATVARALVLPEVRIADGAVLRQDIAGGEAHAAAAAGGGAGSGASQDAPAVSPPVGPAVRENGSDHFVARRRWHGVLKRGLDIAAAAAGLIVLSPVMLLVAVLIRLESRGPVLFAHRRESRGGREFPCYKFRTMQAGAHLRQRQLYEHSEVDGPQFKITHDPRVTRLGGLLRATNIDELPQLFNVLAGHMSLVGPRPSPLRENRICIPWRRARLSVRPGITGLWQVCRSADRSQGDFHEWIYYDIAYVRHFSFWLDLKILAATAATLGGRWSVPSRWLLRI